MIGSYTGRIAPPGQPEDDLDALELERSDQRGAAVGRLVRFHWVSLLSGLGLDGRPSLGIDGAPGRSTVAKTTTASRSGRPRAHAKRGRRALDEYYHASIEDHRAPSLQSHPRPTTRRPARHDRPPDIPTYRHHDALMTRVCTHRCRDDRHAVLRENNTRDISLPRFAAIRTALAAAPRPRRRIGVLWPRTDCNGSNGSGHGPNGSGQRLAGPDDDHGGDLDDARRFDSSTHDASTRRRPATPASR